MPNDKPIKVVVPNDKPIKIMVPSEKPTKTTIPNEKPTKTAIPNEKPTKTAIPSEKPTKKVQHRYIENPSSLLSSSVQKPSLTRSLPTSVPLKAVKEPAASTDEGLTSVKSMWDGYNNQLRNTKAALDAKLGATVTKTHVLLRDPATFIGKCSKSVKSATKVFTSQTSAEQRSSVTTAVRSATITAVGNSVLNSVAPSVEMCVNAVAGDLEIASSQCIEVKELTHCIQLLRKDIMASYRKSGGDRPATTSQEDLLVALAEGHIEDVIMMVRIGVKR